MKTDNLYTFLHKSFYTPMDIANKFYTHPLLKGLMLVWAGIYFHATGHLVSNRTLNEYVLIYCVSGKGWLKIDNHSWNINAGDMFICPPGLPHSYGADSVNPWTKYYIHFRGENVEDYMQLLHFSKEKPVHTIGIHPKLETWFENIFDVLKNGYTLSNFLLVSSYLGNILTYLNSLFVDYNPINSNNSITIQNVITYMLDNLDQSLTLDELAQFCNFSKYHFSRVFQDKTGFTPMDYYIRLKIQRACELLELSNLKLYQISNMLDFQNQYYFSTVFKKIIGISPSQYRAQFNITP